MEESCRILLSPLNWPSTHTALAMIKEALHNEAVVRLSFFVGIFALMSIWE
jgi:hypothetical protein